MTLNCSSERLIGFDSWIGIRRFPCVVWMEASRFVGINYGRAGPTEPSAALLYAASSTTSTGAQEAEHAKLFRVDADARRKLQTPRRWQQQAFAAQSPTARSLGQGQRRSIRVQPWTPRGGAEFNELVEARNETGAAAG